MWQTTGWRQYIIIHYPLSPRFEGRDEAPQDLETVFVGPLMQYPAQKIYTCTTNRLLGKEIVGHELRMVLYVFCDILLFAQDHGLEILNHEGKSRIFASESKADEPFRKSATFAT